MISKEIVKLKKDLSFSVCSLINKEINFELTSSSSIYLLQSNILINLAKIIKKSPKIIFKELNFLSDFWNFNEENGILFINPLNPFNITLDLNFNKEFKNIIYVPTRETSLVEIIRIKSQILSLLYLRESLGVDSNVYFPNDNGEFVTWNSFKEFSLAPICNVDCGANYLSQVNLDATYIVIAFEENINKLFKLANNKKSYLSIAPKIYKGMLPNKGDGVLLSKELLKNPLSASMYFSKSIETQDLDCFVVSSSEQDNILSFISNTYQILNRLEVEKLEACENSALGANKLESKIQQKYIKVILSFSECIVTGNIRFFLDSFDDLLKSFQLFFNTPDLRQKIDVNELTYAQFHVITSIFGLLKLCNTHC